MSDVAADTPTAAYAAMRGRGRLLELPVFRPDIHFGSAYLGYARQSPRVPRELVFPVLQLSAWLAKICPASGRGLINSR